MPEEQEKGIKMYKVGVWSGRMVPPHRGHINSIIQSATMVEKLYVILSDNPERTRKECVASALPYIDSRLRLLWLSKELEGLNHIEVLYLDESDITQEPYDWKSWSGKLNKLIPEKIDVIFGGEPSYTQGYQHWYPETIYKIIDPSRTKYPISGTLIRENPFKYWDYIPGSARSFFTKKVLISGTESCMKTTMTKYLSKLYYTSWSEEVGRYYSSRYLGGREDCFTVKDFERIVLLQDEQDKEAIRTANKITFFDSDAVITQYYLEAYLKQKSSIIDMYINQFKEENKFDYILFYEPDVKWVDDGLRYMGEQKVREENSKKLLSMYENYGYKNIIVINGNYEERLNKTIKIIDEVLK